MALTFSANLGFLWTELPLPERVRRAAAAGFHAVECHFPYEVPAAEVAAVLAETGLPMLSLNTRPGPEGAFGLAALPGGGAAARAAIDEALGYAAATGTGCVHVMAGLAEAGDPAAEAAFAAALAHAAEGARARGLTVLIEPLNPVDVPGYFLADYDRAAAFARAAGPEVRIMLDVYHAVMMGHDPVALCRRLGPLVGHVQIADAPGRGAPGTGGVDFARVLPGLREAGYAGAFGAEYRPSGPVEDGLGWMAVLRNL